MIRFLALICFLYSKLYAADSDSFIISFSTSIPAADVNDQSGTSTANEMRCGIWTPAIGIQSATKMFWGRSQGSPGTGGVAVYSSDGNTRIVTTGAVTYQTGTGGTSVTGLSYSLNAGTAYLVCWCVTGTSWFYVAMGDEIFTTYGTGSITDVENVYVTNFGKAANACVTGAPPTTTGALTAENTWRPMLVVFSKQ